MSDQLSSLVVMEACGGAHHWAREMSDLEHEVKLIAPQYVKPFVKRQKTMPLMLLSSQHVSLK